MSFVCDICGKSNMRGNLVSHSKQRMHRLFKPNLHSAKAIVNGVVKKLLVCTKCLRRLKRPEKKVEKVEKVVKVEQVEKVEKETVPQKPMEMKVKQTTVAELMKEPSFAKASKGKSAKEKPVTVKKSAVKKAKPKKASK